MSVGPRTWTPDALDALRSESGVALATDDASRKASARDFGRLVRGACAAVARPRDANEVARVLAFASARALPVTLRGRGMSEGGQAVAGGGLSLDLTRLDRIDAPDAGARTLRAQGGATVGDIARKAFGAGFLPRVLPLNLDMTIGGLLSAGGIGSTSHRFGPAVANVVEIEVVTGAGRRVRCGRDRERALFDAALGGLGRAGVIAEAVLELRPVTSRVRTVHLLFEAHEPWLEAQTRLVRMEGVTHLEGFCWASAKGIRQNGRARPFTLWQYGLQVGFDQEDDAAIDAVVRDLTAARARVLGQHDEAPLAHAGRYHPRFTAMHATGAWKQAHPWVEYLLPVASLVRLLPSVLDALPPAVGDGHRVLFVRGDLDVPRSFALPEGGDLACFAVLPPGIPRGVVGETTAALADLDARLLEAGARRYLSGWRLPAEDASWRAHYGADHEAWAEAQRMGDPAGILGSALRPPRAR